MGDQLRMTPAGPRSLEDDDYGATNQPKVIRNPEPNRIAVKSASSFEPIVSEARFQALQAKLDQGAGKQRGKPRAQNPSKNPLGCRVFDLNCTWPMYRVPHALSFEYKCGLYQQSHGQRCAHNHIDGLLATRFVLACLQQRLHSPAALEKLEARLRQLAAADTQQAVPGRNAAATEATLLEVRDELKRAERNLAFAANEQQFRAVANGRRGTQGARKVACRRICRSEAKSADDKERGGGDQCRPSG
jgi:hypothetical protein